MLLRRDRKGFTLVELLVVIASSGSWLGCYYGRAIGTRSSTAHAVLEQFESNLG